MHVIASADTIKLRAADARARQEWEDGLRAVVESHTKAMGIDNSTPLPPRELLAALDAMVSARRALYLTDLLHTYLLNWPLQPFSQHLGLHITRYE